MERRPSLPKRTRSVAWGTVFKQHRDRSFGAMKSKSFRAMLPGWKAFEKHVSYEQRNRHNAADGESILGSGLKVGGKTRGGGLRFGRKPRGPPGLGKWTSEQASASTLTLNEMLERRQRAKAGRKPPGYIDPGGTFRNAWNVLSIVCVLYSVVTVPLWAAFEVEHERGGALCGR